MSPEKQRIVIAKELGAKWWASGKWAVLMFGKPANPLFVQVESPDGFNQRLDVPNYPESLDAMYIAEEALAWYPSHERDEYYEILEEIVMRDIETCYGNRKQSVMHAKAGQRAEAFVKVRGKWEDGQWAT